MSFTAAEIDYSWRLQTRRERRFVSPGETEIVEVLETDEVHLSSDLWSRTSEMSAEGLGVKEDVVRVGDRLWRRLERRSWLEEYGVGTDDASHPLLWASAAEPFYAALDGLDRVPESLRGYDTCHFSVPEAQAVAVIDPFEEAALGSLPSRLYSATAEVWIDRPSGRLVAVDLEYSGDAGFFLGNPTGVPDDAEERVTLRYDYSALDDPSLEVTAPALETGLPDLPEWYSLYQDRDLGLRVGLPYAWNWGNRLALSSTGWLYQREWAGDSGLHVLRLPRSEVTAPERDVAAWLLETVLLESTGDLAPQGPAQEVALGGSEEAFAQTFRYEDPEWPGTVGGLAATQGEDAWVVFVFVGEDAYVDFDKASTTLLATLELIPRNGIGA